MTSEFITVSTTLQRIFKAVKYSPSKVVHVNTCHRYLVTLVLFRSALAYIGRSGALICRVVSLNMHSKFRLFHHFRSRNIACHAMKSNRKQQKQYYLYQILPYSPANITDSLLKKVSFYLFRIYIQGTDVYLSNSKVLK